MAQSLIITLKFPLTDLEMMDEDQIELIKHLYLSGLPPSFRRVATCQVVDASKPSYAERMMECVRAEFARYDMGQVYRPRKSYYVRKVGEQS